MLERQEEERKKIVEFNEKTCKAIPKYLTILIMSTNGLLLLLLLYHFYGSFLERLVWVSILPMEEIFSFSNKNIKLTITTNIKN